MIITNVTEVSPKTIYTWIDRLNIITPDITGPLNLSSYKPTYVSYANSLIITVDSPTPSVNIGIAVVLWDERNNPISVNSGQLTLSGWCMNSVGNYIPGYSFNTNSPSFLIFDVSNALGYTVLVQSMVGASSINLHYKLF